MKLTIKEKRFLNLLIKERNIVLIDCLNYNYQKLIDLKNLTEYINFPCSFDKKGNCIGLRKNISSWIKYPQCCCIDCYREYGYLDYIVEKDIPYYLENWDTKTGFWRKEKGCILDRSKRSSTCLTYICGNNKLSSYMSTLRGIMNNIEIKCKKKENKKKENKDFQIVKLKTFEKIKKDLNLKEKDISIKTGWIVIKYKGMEWYINSDMKNIFGNNIEVISTSDDKNYTHKGNGWYWHELWFEKQ